MRPKLLDLFCGAGGASIGYHRAGFDVIGVDIKRQKRYPFEFIQADARDVLRDHDFTKSFDAIHASPLNLYALIVLSVGYLVMNLSLATALLFASRLSAIHMPNLPLHPVT